MEPVAHTLADELTALSTIAPLVLLLWFAVLAVIVGALAVVLPLAVRITWQLGLDPRRRLTLASGVSRLLAPIVAVLGAFLPFWGRAPGLALLGLATFIALAVLASPSSARNLAAGLNLALRARPRPGDLIRIGPLEGTVDDIGLMRVSLRTREGGVTLVPAADFERLPLTIGNHGATVPVEVEFNSPVPLDDAALRRLRWALWFSPIRRAGTEIRLRSDLATGRLHVAIDTWAPRASSELQRHVREILRRSVLVVGPPVDDTVTNPGLPLPDAAIEEDGP